MEGVGHQLTSYHFHSVLLVSICSRNQDHLAAHALNSRVSKSNHRSTHTSILGPSLIELGIDNPNRFHNVELFQQQLPPAAPPLSYSELKHSRH
jgi:hypothetical protein